MHRREIERRLGDEYDLLAAQGKRPKLSKSRWITERKLQWIYHDSPQAKREAEEEDAYWRQFYADREAEWQRVWRPDPGFVGVLVLDIESLDDVDLAKAKRRRKYSYYDDKP